MGQIMKILIAEDDPVSQHILEAWLVKWGYDVTVACSGEEAWESLRSGDTPDLVILDIMMPDIDGIEVCRRMKEEPALRHIPVLFISALTEIADKLKAFDAGGVDYITKPFADQEVRARVQTHLWLAAAQEELLRINRKLTMEVDARRKTEEALQESEKRYRAVVEDQTEIISRVGPDGTFTFVNEVFCRFFGMSASELIGSRWQPVAAPDDIPMIEEMLGSISPENPVVTVENRIFSGSGELRWMQFVNRGLFDDNGHLLEIQSVGRDITKQKRVEEELIWMNAYNRSLIEASLDPLVTIGTDGLITDANVATTEVTGRKWSELIGSDFSNYFTDPDSARLGYQKVFREGAVRDYPLEIRHRDGHAMPVLYNATVYRDPEGEVMGVFAAARDITELKRAEEQRLKLEAQLQQAQKMEAIGTLAGCVAHDFNNILTAIIGYSDLIISSKDQDCSIRQHAKEIYNAAERAADLTQSLLAFSRKQVMQMRPVDIRSVIQECERMLVRLVPEDIGLSTKASDMELIVMADKGQVGQVLMNLVTNAKDAMPKGGALSIEVSPANMDKEFVDAHGFGEPGKYGCIAVSDTGSGMDEKTKKRIFEPFFTTKEAGKGTGLGMSVVYGIVKQHNGFITVHSEKGMGTTFRIYLPLIDGSTESTSIAHRIEPAPAGTETILLAEDDEHVSALGKIILENAGYTVITAVDGIDALERFMVHKAEIAILITDVVMPHIGGKQLSEEIRKIRPDVKVLFLSGYAKGLDNEKEIPEEEFNFMAKPVIPSEMLKKVREILDSV